ncbi:MAG: class I SAM-dependent methyltransferase [Solirubrobacteraceae bacterium]
MSSAAAATPGPDEQRESMLESWQQAAAGWRRRAEEVRGYGMPVSIWMIERLALQPGERVLELAAGPGDTGFLAAELIRPGGALICSDASEAMLDLARERAVAQGVDNVEFQRLELEWIDRPTADIDAILCRWGVMLSLDSGAALHECRRVLKPGGRLTLAVWDQSHRNPWATIPCATMVSLGCSEPPPADAPGVFALADPGQLAERLRDAGFVEVTVEAVAIERAYADFDAFVAETLDLSLMFRRTFEGLGGQERERVLDEMRRRAEPFLEDGDTLRLPGSSLAALAYA